MELCCLFVILVSQSSLDSSLLHFLSVFFFVLFKVSVARSLWN
uniref:Uncharacterized protein n=1 Tax=Rhizophora mucronata TaxID=61149 RepID=A0A2P2MXY7_RHIMU